MPRVHDVPMCRQLIDPAEWDRPRGLGAGGQDRMVQPGVRPGLAEDDPARLRAARRPR